MSAVRCSRLWMAEAVRDGRLKGAEREAYLRHLKTCPECIEESEMLESLAAKLRRLPAPHPDALSLRRQRNRLLADVDIAVMEPPPVRVWRRRAGAVLALAACISVGFVMVRRPRAERPLPADPVIDVRAEPGSMWHQTKSAG